MKELIVEANIESLHEVIDFVRKDIHHCSPELLDDINLAVEEIFVNISSYAYQPACGNVVVSIAVGKEVVIRFEDTGSPYNPLEHPDPDLEKPLMEREIGGLGVFLVKKMMDRVEYTRMDGKNVLVVTKRLTELPTQNGEDQVVLDDYSPKTTTVTDALSPTVQSPPM